MCAAAPYRMALASTWGRIRNRSVGRGILDASMAQSVRGRQGCRPLRWCGVWWWDAPPVGSYDCAPIRRATIPGTAKRPPSATRYGVGTAALRLCRWDCAICGWRFGTMGDFARCGGREFRAVRGAGVSLAAASGSFARCGGRPGALPPGPLRFFEKNRVKLLSFIHRLL